jgi:1,4-dihydroxy-2-naphthoate octaprenyltransferase
MASLLLICGLAPFGLGALLALSSGFSVKGPVLAVGLAAVAALILAGLCSREAYALSGGRWPLGGRLGRNTWRRLAYGGLALAGTLGILLQWLWQTGDLTIPLGALGILGGYFSFAPPLAWQRRGWGEVWGALCFGLAPVFAGYYLQSRHLVSEIVFYGLPLSLGAFNLFLLLGFPVPAQEESYEGFSLASRLGPVRAALLYTIINILTLAALVFCLLFPAVRLWGHNWLWALILLALVNQELVKRRGYYQEARIRLLCQLSLALLLGMNLVFALGLWGRL